MVLLSSSLFFTVTVFPALAVDITSAPKLEDYLPPATDTMYPGEPIQRTFADIWVKMLADAGTPTKPSSVLTSCAYFERTLWYRMRGLQPRFPNADLQLNFRNKHLRKYVMKDIERSCRLKAWKVTHGIIDMRPEIVIECHTNNATSDPRHFFDSDYNGSTQPTTRVIYESNPMDVYKKYDLPEPEPARRFKNKLLKYIYHTNAPLAPNINGDKLDGANQENPVIDSYLTGPSHGMKIFCGIYNHDLIDFINSVLLYTFANGESLIILGISSVLELFMVHLGEHVGRFCRLKGIREIQKWGLENDRVVRERIFPSTDSEHPLPGRVLILAALSANISHSDYWAVMQHPFTAPHPATTLPLLMGT
jgi:hypothetical protein